MEGTYNGIAKDDDQYESEETVQYLPPRFREIAASSSAMESFNYMNDDLISHRVLPPLHTRLRSLILNTRMPEPILSRLQDLLQNSWTPPSSNLSLLFRVKEKGQRKAKEMNFLDCALRDKRLPRFPNQVLERRAFIPNVPHKESRVWLSGEPFMEAIGPKVVWWTKYDPRHPFAYIMNADHSGEWALRPLDTSTICPEIQRGSTRTSVDVMLTAVVGHLLIVLLRLNGVRPRPTHTLCLDVNTETWTLLPQCPVELIQYVTPISWQGKLYLLESYPVTRRFPGRFPYRCDVRWHLDFGRNVWVQQDVNTVFGPSFMGLPVSCYRQSLWTMGCIVSSRSGTLYARVDDVKNPEYPNGCIYAMDDVRSGWKRIELRNVYTQQFNTFGIPSFPTTHTDMNYGILRIEWWPVNADDIILVALRAYYDEAGNSWAGYAWWIFNHNDGVKYYNYEALRVSGRLENGLHLPVLKIEW